jgi:hypothetical protein
MLKITEYGERIRDEFIEHCKDCSKYDIAMDYGLYVLEDCVRGVKDYAAWCILNYDIMALDTAEEWLVMSANKDICWATNWDDLENAFTITHDALQTELNKCFEEVQTEMNIKITFTGEEIKQIEELTGIWIDEKEDLYNAVRTIIDAATSIRKGCK